jgi:hypothetical protein
MISRTGQADLETEGYLVGKTDVERLGDFFVEFMQEPGFEFGLFRFGEEDLDVMFVTGKPVEAGKKLLDHLRQKFAVAKERLHVLLDHGIDDGLLQSFLDHDEEVAGGRFICFRRLSASRLAASRIRSASASAAAVIRPASARAVLRRFSAPIFAGARTFSVSSLVMSPNVFAMMNPFHFFLATLQGNDR